MAKEPYPEDIEEGWPEEDWEDLYDEHDPNAGAVDWPDEAPDEGWPNEPPFDGHITRDE